jgi:hypothetical protein
VLLQNYTARENGFVRPYELFRGAGAKKQSAAQEAPGLVGDEQDSSWRDYYPIFRRGGAEKAEIAGGPTG